MRVHHEGLHARLHEMIKGIGDERSMKDRNEGLGQLVRERTKPLTETRAEDEGFLHERLLSGRAACANSNPTFFIQQLPQKEFGKIFLPHSVSPQCGTEHQPAGSCFSEVTHSKFHRKRLEDRREDPLQPELC